MNFRKHSSLIVSMNLSHLPFKLGDPLGSGLVFTPASLTVFVNIVVNFTSRSWMIILGFFSRSFICSMNHSVCSQTQAESGCKVDSVTTTSPRFQAQKYQHVQIMDSLGGHRLYAKEIATPERFAVPFEEVGPRVGRTIRAGFNSMLL